MQYKVEECLGCKRVLAIVNRKYKLCNECNFERLNGKTVQEDRKEKVSNLLKNKVVFASQVTKAVVQPKSKPIKKVSSKQAGIEREYSKVCKKIDQDREPICEGCGRGDKPLSHSHTISRKRCKDIGKHELIYDEKNLELECYEEPTSNPKACHNIWENGSLEQKKTLMNYDRKLEYIKINDPELYLKFTQLWT